MLQQHLFDLALRDLLAAAVDQLVPPASDLGIRAAIRKAYGLEELPSPAEVTLLGERWQPWRTVASWYLRRSVEPDANL